MMMDNIVTLGERQYYFRLSVRTLHLIEKAMGGKSLDSVRSSLTLDHCVTIARYALRKISTNDMLSDKEFEELIDSIDISEFNSMFDNTYESAPKN